MNSKLIMKIKNFGPIINANVKIDKINVIGGQNATGKSTASKLLYCFLKSNSTKRQNFAYKSIIDEIKELYSILIKYNAHYFDKYITKFLREYAVEMMGDDVKFHISAFGQLRNYFEHNFGGNSSIVASHIQEKIAQINKLVELINNNDDSLFNSIMKSMLKTEFLDNYNIEYYGFLSDDDKASIQEVINHNLEMANKFSFENTDSLLIHDVFYIDSFSTLDLSNKINMGNKIQFVGHEQHLFEELNSKLNQSELLFDDLKNENIINLEKKINNIINGDFISDNGELKYSSKKGIKCSMDNTASGIKQIGIIQLLLAKRKLKENTFLIIDEPEVNLHPEWQVKFAEILLLLVNDLKITLYVNTHSPMFIEAISLYAEYYDLLDNSNFYLTNQNDDKKGYYFNKIDNKDMGDVYENLSRPYDDLDDLKSKLIFKK